MQPPSSSTPATRAALPAALMQLMMDYANQTVEELHTLFGGGANTNHSSSTNDTTVEEGEEEEDPATLEEIAALTERAQRIIRVMRLVQRAVASAAARSAQLSQSYGADSETGGNARQLRTMTASRPDCGNCVTSLALRGLDRLVGALTGSTPSLPSASPPSTSPTAVTGAVAVTEVRRIARPVSLPEAALEVLAMNTKVVFRRSTVSSAASAAGAAAGGDVRKVEKRPRGSGITTTTALAEVSSSSSSGVTGTEYEALSLEQRKARFALYAARTALLPRVDAAVPPYVSPAVRTFAELNVAVEGRLLQRTWCVGTKARLLQELPKLYDAVQRYREDVQPFLVEGTRSLSPSRWAPHVGSFFDFLSYNDGVVRVAVQRGLLLDVTYDVVKRRWVLLQMQWALWTRCATTSSDLLLFAQPFTAEKPEATTTTITTTADAVPDGGESSPSTSCSSDGANAEGALRRVVPNHQDAMVRFLQKRFDEDGFDGGCIAANRLLCTVVIDAVAHQLKSLKEDFFVGPLRPLFDVEVRAGTHVACRFQQPHRDPPVSVSSVVSSTEPTAHSSSRASHSAGAVLHAKFSITGGTVVLERAWSTDASVLQHDLLLLVPPAATAQQHNAEEAMASVSSGGSCRPRISAVSPSNRVCIDVEQWLWDGVGLGSGVCEWGC